MKIKIGVQVGMTIQIMGVDYVKPSVWAECEFDEEPTESELKKRWEWLWANQVAPQSEQLLDLMSKSLTEKVGSYRSTGDVQSYD
jgi:hypothetical protein